jgi:hypothetical protein
MHCNNLRLMKLKLQTPVCLNESPSKRRLYGSVKAYLLMRILQDYTKRLSSHCSVNVHDRLLGYSVTLTDQFPVALMLHTDIYCCLAVKIFSYFNGPASCSNDALDSRFVVL